MNRSVRAVVAGLEHGVVSSREEVVDFLVVHVLGGERGQQVGGAIGGLDQRDVSWRQQGQRVLGEPLLGEGARTGTDELLYTYLRKRPIDNMPL